MRIFSDFDVYEHKYTYDEMKVMHLIDKYDRKYQYDKMITMYLTGNKDINSEIFLDYEDLCRIAEAVYAHWANDDERYEEKIGNYPWIKVQGFEEEGYIQAYAHRVLPEFIRLYKEWYLY